VVLEASSSRRGFRRRARFGPARIVLAVATFNRRAISVYERAGFVPVRTYMHSTNGGQWEFLEMELRER
jgi:ribosomal-protein-alanine N-acetyltransferase